MRRSLADWLAGVKARDPSTLAATALAVLLLVAILVIGPWVVPDTRSYVTNSVTRAPLYPLFLDLFEAIFGDGFALPAALVQSGLAVLCAFRLAGALRIHGGLGRPGACLLVAVLLVPLARYGPMMTAEALTYGLFLWFAALLFEGVATRSPRAVVAASALCALAVLARDQYLCLVPALGLYWAGQLFFARGGARRSMGLAVGLSVALLIGQFGAQRAYNYFVHGVFMDVSLAGLSMVTVQLYISDPGEIEHFEEGVPRRVLARIYPILEEREWQQRHRPELMPAGGHYQFVFDQIAYRAVLPSYRAEKSIAKRSDMTPHDWADLNAVGMEITRELVLLHPKRYVALMAQELYQKSRYFFLLVALLPVIAAGLWVQSRDPWWAAVGLVGLAACANYALVVLTHSILLRYTYVTDTVVLVAVAASLMRVAGAPGVSRRP